MEKLNKHNEKVPFKVPEGYFEGLTDRIMENCENSSIPQHRSAFAFMKPFLALAAIIAGAALLTFAVLQTIPSGISTKQPVAGMNNGQIGGDDMTEMLYEGIDIFMIESALYGEPESTVSGEEFGKDEIIEYLLLGQIDFSLLYEHLDAGMVL
jgi:hypothetical protein